MFQDEVITPISATVLGVAVGVVHFDLERRAVRPDRPLSTPGDHGKRVALADIHFGRDSVVGCLRPFPVRLPPDWAWLEQ